MSNVAPDRSFVNKKLEFCASLEKREIDIRFTAKYFSISCDLGTKLVLTLADIAFVSFLFVTCFYEEDLSTEADKGQSQNIYEIRKNIFKIRKNNSNRNVFWKSSLKSLSNPENYHKS